MFLSRFARLAIALLTLAVPAAANILTVGPAGSGAQFTQIQAAVDAAASDDVILVKPGNYQGFVAAKPVRILGDGTGAVNVQSSVIRDIAAGAELVLSGVNVFVNPFSFSPSILVRNCAGTVVLQGMRIPGELQICLRIESSARLVLLDSLVFGGIYGASRTGAISAQDSELWIANTDVSGTNDCCFATRSSHGIELANSTLHVWRSRIRGGTDNSKQSSGQLADGGTGIKAVSSTVNLFGGPTSLVSGGNGFGGFGASQNSPGGPGMDLALSSRARIQQSIPVNGGLDSERVVRAPAIQVDGTSSFTLDPKVFPTLLSSARQVQVGSTFTLTLEGNPGGYQVLFLSLRTGPTTIYRRVDGFGLLDRPNMVRVASEVLPASGVFTLNVRVPNMTSLLGATGFFQAAEQVGSSHAIGNPVLVTITG